MRNEIIDILIALFALLIGSGFVVFLLEISRRLFLGV